MLRKITSLIMAVLLFCSLSVGAWATVDDAFLYDQAEEYTEDYWNDDADAPELSQLLLTSLAIGAVVALIVILVLRGQLKSVRQQNKADQYVKAGSMHITESNDFFLYRTVSRVKKESSNGRS